MNGFGRVMYRFDEDTAKPSKSNCDAECVTTWPPVVVAKGATVYFKDVRKQDIGLLDRADGTRQLTVGGWPAYYYGGDTELADTKGQGVGGTWFGMGPDGAKAPAVGSGEDNVVELFADPKFTGDPLGTILGVQCVDVSTSADDLASSIKVKTTSHLGLL
ncbi:hypothetical protein [Umezawaea sp. Da 62-37]|uniref:hypothetical protein n=1 Tax=Umezawaea sp. Da 62-37 TaxID=3075927 RepID=UPI0028F6E6AF|nr:hypothetical protein [Umezawaea sp. Da 62-37]WNV88045.1 hypothetical protein RM788_07085 [Umezawaea sp. Da 62-37]